jgi:hypothetical protein
MESIIGPRVGTMFEREQLVQFASTNPKFSFVKKDEGFREFAANNGYPVPQDDTLWCLDFISPGVYQSRLECLWEQYKEGEVGKVTAIVDGTPREVEMPGDNPIRYSMVTTAVKKVKNYGGDLLDGLGLPKEGVKSIKVREDDIDPRMEFEMEIFVDNSLAPNSCEINYITPTTMSRLDRILASIK